MIRLHHLEHSQSERIIWLCEELGLDYELVRHQRDATTRLSPPALVALHPMAAAPVIEDGALLLAESAAIVDYLIAKYGAGRLTLSVDDADFAHYLYWFHFANGNLQPTIGRLMVVNRAGLAPDHPVLLSVRSRFERMMALVEKRLEQAPYLAGSAFTAADIMSVFSFMTMRLFQPFDLTPYGAIRAWLQRCAQRPAYRRAMAAGDPDLVPMLD